MQNTSVYSVEPEQASIGYWPLMVPKDKPRNMLMLGGAGNTIGRLSRMAHGDFPLTIVDIESAQHIDAQTRFVAMDAEEYVRMGGEAFDWIVVDIFVGEEVPRFVFDEDFVQSLSRIASGGISLNCAPENPTAEYERQFNTDRITMFNANKVAFFSV